MKGIKWLVACMMALMLVGCNEEAPRDTVTVCQGELDGIQETFTFNASGDEITKQTEEFIISIEDLGIPLEDYQADHSIVDTEAVKEALFSTMFNGSTEVNGMSMEVKTEEDHLSFIVTTDYTVADFDALAEAGLIEEGSISTTYISLQRSIEGLEERGMTCTEQ